MVYPSVTVVSPAKTPESIKMLFWVEDLDEPKEACVRWGAHWRHLPNTIELSIELCGVDAALSNNFDHLFMKKTDVNMHLF